MALIPGRGRRLPMVVGAIFAALLVVAAPPRLAGQVPESERIPLTDPNRLEAMGFPKDARTVYVWKKASQGAPVDEPMATVRAKTWGTSPGYMMIMNSQFQAGNPFFYDLVNGASQGSWCEGGAAGECLGYAQIAAPEGATLDQLDFWGYDDSADSDLHYAVIANCDVGLQQIDIILDSGDLVGSSGPFHFSHTFVAGPPFDNAECGYSLRVKFTDPGEPPRGSAIRIRKARIAWTRHVSEPPEAATFGDVPVDHQFFQFVEALAKSGVTLGCGGGADFCPDSPVTRGQMAAFLARALGLEFP